VRRVERRLIDTENNTDAMVWGAQTKSKWEVARVTGTPKLSNPRLKAYSLNFICSHCGKKNEHFVIQRNVPGRSHIWGYYCMLTKKFGWVNMDVKKSYPCETDALAAGGGGAIKKIKRVRKIRRVTR